MPHLNHSADTTQPAAPLPPGHVYVSEKQLTDRLSIHRSTLRRWRLARGFPKPVHFSEGCTRWRLDEVVAWEQSQARG
jgi:prophage regulatory protein